MRSILAALLGLAILPAVLVADDPAKKNTKADEKKAEDKKANPKNPDGLAEIQAEIKKVVPKVRELMQSAETPEQQAKALAPLVEPLKKAITLAKADPKGEQAIEACEMVLNFTRQVPDNKEFQELSKETFAYLAEHHVNNPKLEKICRILMQVSIPGSKEFFDTVAKKTNLKSIKGMIAFSAATAAMSAWEELEEEVGKEKEAEAKADEAEKLFDAVLKEFGEVKFGRGTLADQAQPMVFELKNLRVGRAAPDAEAVDLDGKKVKLSDHRGKVVVLDFWATWCPPCRALIPKARTLVEKNKDRPLTFIGVSTDDKAETVKKFMEKNEMPWVHWHGQELSNLWNIQAIPTLYVIDHKGVIRHRKLSPGKLAAALEPLLKEAETAKK